MDDDMVEPLYGGTSQLIKAWLDGVRAFAADVETGTNERDRTVHDLSALLFLRNAISGPFSAAQQNDLETADALYRSATVEDADGIGDVIGDVAPDTSYWWWRRIPRAGEIRAEIEQIRARRRGRS